MFAWLLLDSVGSVFEIFKEESLLLPSIHITYHKCTDVKVERTEAEIGTIVYRVTGKRRNLDVPQDIGASNVETFDHLVRFQRVTIYTEATHF